MSNLTGDSIVQLQELQQTDRIRAEDRFFISHPASLYSGYKNYISKSLRYGDLVESMFADLNTGFGFGSMSHEISSAYSKADHTHWYNTFDVKADYDYRDPDYTTLATFKVGNRTVRLCMPRLWTYAAAEPVVGELKFKALPYIPDQSEIDVNSGAFDGWVYPAGQSYSVQAQHFKAAKRCFGQNETATTLQIPNIDGFIVPADVSHATFHTFSNGTFPQHSHSQSVQLNGGSQTVRIQAKVTKNAGTASDYGSMHNGDKPYTPNKTFTSTLALKVSEIEVSGCDIGSSSAQFNKESYPSFRYLPMMIYIGKKQ